MNELVALLADPHFGARADSPIFHQHFTKFFSEVFFPALKQHRVSTVVILGDLLDRRKYVNFASLQVLQEALLDPLRSFDVHVIVGNHDSFYKTDGTTSGLRSLLQSYSNVTLHWLPQMVELLGHSCFMLPWTGDVDYEQKVRAAIKDKSAEYLFGHLELKGFEMYRGFLNSERGLDDEELAGFGKVFSGHYHQRTDRGRVVYVGAPYEITWADAGCARGFGILDLGTGGIDFVDNPHRIFAKVVLGSGVRPDADPSTLAGKFVKVVVEDGQDQKAVHRFIEQLQKTGSIDVSVVEGVAAEADGPLLTVADNQDTIAVIKEYVQAWPGQVDKAKLSDLLVRLYATATAELSSA